MKNIDALIIGAGPTGLFTAHQLRLIGLDCEIVDNLDKIGGQCIELYPDKPIYDIPAVPECTGEELTNNLINQIKNFDPESLNEINHNDTVRSRRIWEVFESTGKKFSEWRLNKNKKFITNYKFKILLFLITPVASNDSGQISKSHKIIFTCCCIFSWC